LAQDASSNSKSASSAAPPLRVVLVRGKEAMAIMISSRRRLFISGL